jgi:hypothetical protein
MRKYPCLFIPVLFISAFFYNFCSAQTKAVTETGDEVVLYNNYTWKYSKDPTQKNIIKWNGAQFTKSKNATFLLKSTRTHTGFWLDPATWTFEKSKNNPAAEYEFHDRGSSLQGLVIPDATNIPYESFPEILITNAKEASPDFEVENMEYRMVNGIKVLYLQSTGTLSGIKFMFYGYYYSDSVSAIQFLTYGFYNNKDKDQKLAESLLNVFVAIKPNSPEDNQIQQALPTGTPDSLKDGLNLAHNNCKKFFEGKWKYIVSTQNIYVERSFDKTTEYTGIYSTEYNNEWISDCEYDLTFIRSDIPGYTLQKKGDKMRINIMSIDDNVMKYKCFYKNREIEGEMVRDRSGSK